MTAPPRITGPAGSLTAGRPTSGGCVAALSCAWFAFFARFSLDCAARSAFDMRVLVRELTFFDARLTDFFVRFAADVFFFMP